MLVLDPILRGVALPAVVALLILLAGHRWGAHRTGSTAGAASAIAVGAACVAGFVAMFGRPTWPPAEHWQRLAYLAVLSIPTGWATAHPRVPAPVRWGILALAAAVCAWAIVPTWKDVADARAAWLLGTAALLASVWLALRSLASRGHVAGHLLGLIVVCIASAVVMIQSHNAKLAQLDGALGAALAVAALVAWRSDRAVDVAALAAPAAILLVGVAVNGKFYDYGGVPEASFVLVAAAPVWLSLSATLHPCQDSAWRSALASVTLVSLPAAFAVALALASGSGGDGSDYGAY